MRRLAKTTSIKAAAVAAATKIDFIASTAMSS
jgi:hypothetical protein